WEGWEDSAVPPEKLGGYLRDLRDLMERYGYHGAYYGHFGQGCIHLRIDFDLMTAEGISHFRSFIFDAADLCIGYGGSISGEHGDGQSRGELLPRMFGDELVDAFREFKAIWDPQWKMNPGKMVDAYPLDTNLRLGTDYQPPPVDTEFAYPDDHGSFAEATLRCVGVGKCRRLGEGTMCPSFMATREEEHSTRGRARLLFEMLRGDPMAGGWRDEKVREALDLCLACKGCKGECPVNVDMATYKAEFLAHYYRGRLRPRSAYFFGLIMYWARLAAMMPGMANLATQWPLLRDISKAVVGVARPRRIPAFPTSSFKQQYRRRRARGGDGRPVVILWPDTFNNHFHPGTAMAAVDVLEAAGFRVRVPDADLCCGRPLYDYGMIGLAKRLLRQVLATLREEIRQGIPVVGLEPSCLSVFKDELVQLFPHDEDALRLSRQCYTLGGFLEKRAPDLRLPTLKRQALVHGHCHHKSVLDMGTDLKVLGRIGMEYTELDSGCCGMAGAFGFESNHHDVAEKVGERVLLPAVRS
ncbi:MAG TPA: FAD-linked oxidase C-terminal domain-containing protein, partial [Chloroflexota bacterium]|nr:FAD-linked oxidase C-terminal domain-containing protein [Chloroflexota bacterium]